MLIEKDILFDMYITKKMNIKDISKELRVSTGSICNYMKKYNIKGRSCTNLGFKHSKESLLKMSKAKKGKKISEETRKKMSLSQKGKFTNPSKYGGHRKLRKDGYITVYLPSHPYATKDGHVMEHILVMEDEIKSYITRDKVVHHINKIKTDNRIENLKLMDFSEHARQHALETQLNIRLKKREDDCYQQINNNG